ncbi:HAMP domain-containing histidine kinase [Cupriavidus gilardii]|uniref:ATP-binding protein n=1 Tax=Cupriavidus gilardii TaxID=82541 RepID=UPI001EE5CB5D|nr:ATP-binding protein [Cupriavidus gilardii]MCG5259449.1 ATP-binding protein [Cupriavidus gilardii]MDF9429652.1 HAMP domain-containing histidine kinase [Cupriavidus gilardii]
MTMPAHAAAHAAASDGHAPRAPGPGRDGLLSLRRVYWLRWAILSGQGLLLVWAETLAGLELPYRPLLSIFVLQAIFNLLTAWRLRQHARAGSVPGDAELMGQLLVDLTALSAILFFTGGATNPFVSFYLPGLALAAAIVPWRQVVALALYALACYSLMLFEYVPLHLHDPDNAVVYHLVGMWLNFVASAVMIALFVARLSGVLREREGQLADARERLLREARVESLNAQAATVAHEIGTPLATLAVIAGELRADAADPTRGNTAIRDYLPDLHTVEQQLALCRDILARLREANRASALQPVGQWLPAFADGWQLRHPQVRVETAIAAEAAYVPIEPARTGQMLTILLDNAALSQQAAGRGDLPLRLSIAREPSGEPGELVLRVIDHGTGMPAALRARLGEAPVASTHGGQGIGAYLAQSVARQMGGRLLWQDRPEGGTVAELRLPANPDASEHAA